MNGITTTHPSMKTQNANNRFKSGFSSWFWGSMILATGTHFGFFAFLEFGEVQDVSMRHTPLPVMPPPKVEIPESPEPLSRPAMPVVTDAVIDIDITIAPITFEKNPVRNLKPRTGEVETDIGVAPVFTPYTVKPGYTNAAEVQRALEREYPPLLRDAGIGGTVKVWLFIDEHGDVQNQVVNESSGHEALDAAALRVAPVFRFTPALNRDKAVPVWVSLPITFRAN